MNYSDIQHRFANKLEGKNGCIKAGNVRYEGRNYFSYSTVFGQWVDISKNVVVIFEGSTSKSSSKHQLHSGIFPKDVHVFPYDDGGYGRWHGCELLEYSEELTINKRLELIDYYVECLYNAFKYITTSKRKGAENVDFSDWGYVEKLCELYKDTTVNKYLKYAPKNFWKGSGMEGARKIKMVKLIAAGERNVETITDKMFGEGTFKKYWEYCERFRKADRNKEKMLALCNRIGIANPYEHECWSSRWKANLTTDEIRKLSAKERNEIHFASLMRKEWYEKKDERNEKYNKRKDNAYKWIVGCEPIIDNKYSHSYKYCENVRNMFTGEVYECGGGHIYGFYWCDTEIKFEFDKFRKSEDKEQWIANFYAKCKEVADNRKAISILKTAKANTREKAHSWDDDRYILDEKLTGMGMDADSLAIVTEFIRKQDKHYADEEARRRAEEIARLKREEEERKEREYMENVKREQIDECIKEGTEGCRDLWRKNLTSIGESEERYDEVAFNSDGDFFYHGNVLLRLNLNKDKVETSKSIRIPVEVCKKMWKIVSKWHENPSCFKPMQIDTKDSGTYTISSYEDDILTAGCHKIAYAEMQRMYNEIVSA